MKNLKSFSLEGLKNFFAGMGEKDFRGDQVFEWLWKRGVNSINDMTNLSKILREKLNNDFFISELKVVDRKISMDGSQKFLFGLEDGEGVESMFIPVDDRKTVCISTQVGCGMGCKFCATGMMGFIRNLKFYEIVDQVLQIQKLTGERITNVVLMGMGEPMLNLNEVLKALEIINKYIGIGARKITVSTVGIVPGIKKIASIPNQYKLAISLNFPTDEERTRMMPVNSKYPINALINAAKQYYKMKGLRVTFEYILFMGLNDSEEHAVKLAKIARSLPSKINIIPFNPVKGICLKAPSGRDVDRFVKILYPLAPAVTVRWSKGSDISGACGQLRSRSA